MPLADGPGWCGWGWGSRWSSPSAVENVDFLPRSGGGCGPPGDLTARVATEARRGRGRNSDSGASEAGHGGPGKNAGPRPPTPPSLPPSAPSRAVLGQAASVRCADRASAERGEGRKEGRKERGEEARAQSFGCPRFLVPAGANPAFRRPGSYRIRLFPCVSQDSC
jgi:hypothetical protein